MTQIGIYLDQHNILHHSNQGITIATVSDAAAGVRLSEDLLNQIIDRTTVLYLSGGSTPKALYTNLAKAESIEPGAVAMVDERFGPKFHDKSNEKMMRETGLLRYLQMKNIPFYPILQGDGDRVATADKYDEQVRSLNATYRQSVAILGIGTDGHTSSLAPNRNGEFINPMFAPENSHLVVGEFDDPKSMYGQRVGMTFLGLSLLDALIVLVFGEDKKNALENLFEVGPEELIPSRFYKRPDISPKTLFITDHSV